MALVFAGITPHPPALIPAIGKETGLMQLAKTKTALEQLEQDLYLAKTQVLIVLSPHEGRYDDAFVVNGHTTFKTSFEDFGDAVTSDTFSGSPDLAAKIGHAGREEAFDIRVISEERIGHGAGVPLHYISTHLPDIRILPIGFSNRTPEDHLRFGEVLKDIIMNSTKNIAVIASGDLAHCMTKDAPAGYDKDAAKIDSMIIKALENRDLKALKDIDKQTLETSQECGYRTIMILMGIIKNMDYEFHSYSYEHPFGVGYLVGNFAL